MNRGMQSNSAGWLGGGAIEVRQSLAVLLALLLAAPAHVFAERTKLKPGVNMFSIQQDVEIGQQNAAQADRQLPLIRDARVENYINKLGRRLAAKAPGAPYPYRFRVVNDRGINAFALPGGFIYVNRGVIEAADNEAQLASVIGHEIGHVALRHGTNQATKASFGQLGLGVLGAVLGSGSIAAVAAQLGANFGLGSVLLKYSRDAERQADLLGAQILFDTNYDPRAGAQFFEKLIAQERGGRPPEFFSSHPNPENRQENIMNEVSRLGGLPQNFKSDSSEFRQVREMLLKMPPPPRQGGGAAGGTRPSGPQGRPEAPSARYRDFEGPLVAMQYPENWEALGGDRGPVAFIPPGGIVDDGQGNQQVGYGMLVSIFTPQAGRSGDVSLEEATEQLLEDLRRQNPNMRFEQRRTRIRIGGDAGLSTYFSNPSPFGGNETGWVVTVLRRDGLVNIVSVAPENEFDRYDRTFQDMLGSLKFRR